jgi:mRNA interferase RelE/StbE
VARYSVRFRQSVAKDLKAIPKRDVQRIMARIGSLAEDPRPPQAEKLTGDDKYRIRQGVYRILYQIEDEVLTVCVVKVGHRKEIYRSI